MLKKHAQFDLQREADILNVIVADIDNQTFKGNNDEVIQNLIDDISSRCNEVISIVDSNGIIIADTDRAKVGKKIRFSDKISTLFSSFSNSVAFSEDHSGLLRSYNYADKNLWIYPMFGKSKNWLGTIIFKYNISSSGAVYVLKHLFIFWVVLLVLLIVIASIYSLFFSFKLVEPLKLLQDGAESVAGGDLSHKVPIKSDDEFGLVASAFNQMTDRLSRSYRRLTDLFRYVKTILDTIGCIVLVMDDNGIIKSVNKKACELLKYRRQELVGISMERIIGPEILNEILETSQVTSERQGSEMIKQADFLTKNREKMRCLYVTIGTKFENSRLIILSAQDLRPMIALQQQLTDEKNRLLVTLRSIGDGVIVTDLDGRITLINRAAEELTGWREGDAQGQPVDRVFRIVNEFTREPYGNPFEKVLESGQVVDLPNHTILLSRDGREISVADSGAPIFDKDHKVIGVVLVFRDVTKEKQIQKEMLKIEKLESIGVLAGGIAHDFNNILAGILGNIELASMTINPDHKATKYLEMAEKATLRATSLTQQLLTFAKGGEPIKKVSSLKEIIIDSTSFVLSGTNIKCEYDFSDSLWAAEVDKGQISQVIQNFVINARHAMSQGGKITIRCSNVSKDRAEELLLGPVDNYIEIVIRDEGIGIPQDYLSKIFEPFFTTKKKGSGLGLSICHSIIRKHGGHIRVSSEPGQGTTFYIYLPAVVTKQTKQFSNKTVPPKANGRILVMDDEKMVREIAKDMLENLGYEIVTVADGQMAIEAYKKEMERGRPFDAVILDITVPGGLGGEDTIKELLKIDEDATVIVSSGYANDPIMSSYERFGFKACISKPYSLRELSKVLGQVNK